MLEGLPSSLLANAGAVGILAVAVLGILRGWLVPGRSLDQMLALHKERLDQEKARGDEWRAVAETASARADERDRQTEKLLEVIASTSAVLGAVQRALEAPQGQRQLRSGR
jgi:hypothetical protein